MYEYKVNVVNSLKTLPANDGNFLYALKKATDEEIEEAFKWLSYNVNGNKSRFAKVKAELRRRDKARKISEQNA